MGEGNGPNDRSDPSDKEHMNGQGMTRNKVKVSQESEDEGMRGWRKWKEGTRMKEGRSVIGTDPGYDAYPASPVHSFNPAWTADNSMEPDAERATQSPLSVLERREKSHFISKDAIQTFWCSSLFQAWEH